MKLNPLQVKLLEAFKTSGKCTRAELCAVSRYYNTSLLGLLARRLVRAVTPDELVLTPEGRKALEELENPHIKTRKITLAQSKVKAKQWTFQIGAKERRTH